MIGLLLNVGCTPNVKPYLAEERNEKWVKDLTYVEKALPKVHKNLYFKISEEEFITQIETLKERVPQYTDDEIEVELSQVIASIGDTHTGSNISSEWVYPVEFYWFKEGIYIINTNKAYQELLDAKVIAVNHQKIEDAAQRLRPLLAGGNENWFKTQVVYYLSIPKVLKYFKVSTEDELEFEVQLTTGEVKIIKMRPVFYKDYRPVDTSNQPVPMYGTHADENYWYEYLENEKILYINYRRCRQMRDKPFEIFLNEVWEFIKKHKVEKIVLDLRDNGGGRSPILEPFIKKLKKSSFNETGKLYVVIGRRTYSSAVLNVVRLKKDTKAIFVGEATGGSPNHYGDIKQLELPNSKWHIHYSTKYFHWFKEDVDTFKPDVPIDVTFEDYKTARDAVLEWIIEHKKQPGDSSKDAS
jgi:hypothetical protein